jgi:hypothetical protein
VTPAAALAFLLSAPAINPVVLASTAVAFPGEPGMVVGRLVASLATAVAMGWLWLRWGRDEWLRPPARPDLEGLSRWGAFLAACRHDATQAGGFLVVGAATAAILNVLVPPRWLDTVAGHPVGSVLALAVLAVVLTLCSEADAFVAAPLTQFSLTARLAFLVVGPMVDLKLFAMQAGAFGRRFAVRFAPATVAVGVAMSVASQGGGRTGRHQHRRQRQLAVVGHRRPRDPYLAPARPERAAVAAGCPPTALVISALCENRLWLPTGSDRQGPFATVDQCRCPGRHRRYPRTPPGSPMSPS